MEGVPRGREGRVIVAVRMNREMFLGGFMGEGKGKLIDMM
jgi:hypothetical protein